MTLAISWGWIVATSNGVGRGRDRDADDVDGLPPVRPALKVLRRDQDQLLSDLSSGFDSLRDAIEWYQRASIRTFGLIADEWPPATLAFDDDLVRTLLGTDERAIERERLALGTVLPACRDAFRDLRGRSGEYISDDEDNLETLRLDPEDQVFLAMRPGYHELDIEQREALTRLWAGFDGLDDLRRYLHWLNEPTHGELEEDLSRQILYDDLAVRRLLADESTPAVRAYQNLVAISELLPAFADGARELSAGEKAKLRRVNKEDPHL